jgi:hypothetical protein
MTLQVVVVEFGVADEMIARHKCVGVVAWAFRRTEVGVEAASSAPTMSTVLKEVRDDTILTGTGVVR